MVSNDKQKYPLLLKPVIKDYLWGGTRLKTEFGFETDKEIAAEGWMLSCHKDGTNIVDNGAKALMSSHVMKYTSAERVLEIALWHQSSGADISKIVVGADNREQEIENLRIINLLKEKLDIPFIFLSSGECRILKRIGGEIGSCMYLCVYEHDSFSTLTQPL